MTTRQPPQSARVVIIGGGIAGCSVAYHLAQLGWKDIVLLERKQLTCGTTWHAAGLLGQVRASQNMTKLAKYSTDLFQRLEMETGISTGIRQCGSISVALTEDRMEELLRSGSMARAFGVDVEPMTMGELTDKYPYLNTKGVVGSVWIPGDGQGDPANIAMALAKGARMQGADIFEGFRVTDINLERGRVTSIDWQADGNDDQGRIACDMVVNCGGMWARDVGAMAGVSVPLQACEHFYIVTEAIDGLSQLPVLRVPDECAYYKEDAGKIMLGAFEPQAKPWAIDGIPETFCFDQLPEDFEHFEPILADAVERFPLLAETGIHTFFNGPESFTPDDAYHLGPSPEVPNFFVCAGFNSIGIQSSGGAGMALSHWMDAGYPPYDLSDVDIRRMQPFMGNKSYLCARVTETLGLLYADHYPYRQKATGRNVRKSPLHDLLDKQGAVFGETAGWERANWFANKGQARNYHYGWSRQNWFENQRNEHLAIRNHIGIYDMSSFGKIRIEGREAEAFLNYICGANLSVPVGKIVYTQFLNDRGGIESDVTITRLGEHSYLVVTPAATVVRDMNWINRHREGFDAYAIDVTSSEAVIAVMGPNSRSLLQSVSSHDWSDTTHPFGWASSIEIGMGLARAHRVSYVGEMGWEIYVSSDMAVHVMEHLLDTARGIDAKLCGLHAMDSCRIEKGFRHFGHDITEEDHVLEAGLGFAVDLNKAKFVGRDAVLSKQANGLDHRLVQFKLNEEDPLLFHNEPILRDGKTAGYISSGNFGHSLGRSLGMGYIPCTGESAADILASTYTIEIAGTLVAATPSLKPFYDPKSERTRTPQP